MKIENHEDLLLIQDIKNKFVWSMTVRYLLVIMGIILVYLATFTGIAIPLSLPLIAFVCLYNLAGHLIYTLKKHFHFWEVVSMGWIYQLLDLSAITWLIYITGWLESPYWFLYLIMIITAGFGMFSYYSLSVFFIAFFSALFYLGLLLAAYLRLLPIYGPEMQLSPQELLLSIYNKAVFTSLAFFLFSVTIYYFSKLLNEQKNALSHNNLKLLAALNHIKDVDRMKDEFISTASHELRTPIAVVRENMALIEDGVVGDTNEKQKQLLTTSRQNIDRLAKILDNLLDISKIESRSLTLNKKTADLGAVAQKAVELLANHAKQKDLALETKLPEKAVFSFDPEQVLQVFINLIDNAIKYTPSGGKITVEVEGKTQEVVAYVSDTGYGIEKKDFAKVFERFVHIDREHGSFVPGSGLGLSICKGIIEMHGGKIWLESELNKGSKFIFSLPRVKNQ